MIEGGSEGPPTYAPIPPKSTARATFSSHVRGSGGWSCPVSFSWYACLVMSVSLSFRWNVLRGGCADVEFGRMVISGCDAI